jgi:hypothetical protein
VLGYNPLPKLLYLSLPFSVFKPSLITYLPYTVSRLSHPPRTVLLTLLIPQHPSSYHFNVCIRRVKRVVESLLTVA